MDALGDSDKFPKNWIFKHRWQKRKQSESVRLPWGEQLAWVDVGGRTSAFVPSRQKKVLPPDEPLTEENIKRETNGTKRKRSAGQLVNGNSEKKTPEPKPSIKQPARQKAKAENKPSDTSTGRRRSARLMT